MAKVYDYKGETNLPVVLEDPRVTSNEMYFFGWLHDKDSLSPVFNAKLNVSAIGTVIAGFGGMDNNISQADAASNIRNDQLFLRKPTTHVNPRQANVNITSTSTSVLDDNMWWTLDRSYENGGNNHLISDGVSTVFVMQYGMFNATSVAHRFVYGPLSQSQRLDQLSIPTTNRETSISHTMGGSRNAHFIGVNSVSKLVYGLGGYAASSPTHDPNRAWIAFGPTFPSSMSTSYQSVTNLSAGNESQFIGLSLLDGNPLFINVDRTSLTAASTVQKVTWQSTTPTVTQMYTVSAAISASGTNAGGNKMASNRYPASCSQWFNDPRVGAGTTKCWYYPWFDSNRNFHPLVYTWNQTNDTFNRETDITITGDLSSVHADMTNLYSYTSSGAYISANMLCHTFVNSGNRYVMFINIDSRNQYPTTPGPRTSVVYAVDAANPKALTYHSRIVWPDTPKNIVWLNDAQTLMGMFFQNNFKVYAWNNSTGWQETTSINKQVTSCGRDSDGRIWYVQSSEIQANTAPELHILTPSLPVSITITPELSSYDYAGTPINSYINVSAYSASGARIAADVKLVINGGSMTFSDSTTVKTITTSTSAETQQNIIITGAGFSNITASVEI
jgi:hypothetical protein